jgi:hypothetical protein
MKDVTREAWTTPSLNTLAISLDTAVEVGSATDGGSGSVA